MTQVSEPSELSVVGGNGAPSSPSSPAQFEELIEHSPEFEANVEEIRNRYGSNLPFLFPWVEDQIRRRLGVPPLSMAAALLSGLLGVGVRLAVALGATALVGDSTEIPWGRWAVILAFYGLFEATQPWRTPPLDVPAGATVGRIMNEMTALVPTMVRDSDVSDLTDVVRRRYRLLPAAMTGVAVAALMVSACWLFTPSALGDIPIGSLALLTFLIYDVGAVMVYGVVFQGMFMAREARYDHRLFWPSPADSPEVKKNLRTGTSMGWFTATWITLYLVLSVVLVSWDSQVVVPLAAGFTMTAYLTTIGTTLWVRASLHKIVQRVREQRLAVLQDRIDGFGPRFADLSARESERLRDLMDVYKMIRDAPTTPTTSHTLMHTAVTLIIPTIMFLITVLGEVYAERFLDAILP